MPDIRQLLLASAQAQPRVPEQLSAETAATSTFAAQNIVAVHPGLTRFCDPLMLWSPASYFLVYFGLSTFCCWQGNT